MATGRFKRLFPNFQFLKFSSESSHYNKVFEDVIDRIDTASDTVVFIGFQYASGVRMFLGYLYAGKDYGACLVLQYDGTCKVQFLNNGTMTVKDLTQ